MFSKWKIVTRSLEKFFGCQWQADRANENPTVAEFVKITQSLRVINSIAIADITGSSNCRGSKRKAYDLESVNLNKPINKRKRRHVSNWNALYFKPNNYLKIILKYTLFCEQFSLWALGFGSCFLIICLYCSKIEFVKENPLLLSISLPVFL